MRFVVPLVLFLALTSGSARAVLLLGAEDSRAVQSPQSSTSKNDLQAVRNDLERMKALVQQMESHLERRLVTAPMLEEAGDAPSQ